MFRVCNIRVNMVYANISLFRKILTNAWPDLTTAIHRRFATILLAHLIVLATADTAATVHLVVVSFFLVFFFSIILLLHLYNQYIVSKLWILCMYCNVFFFFFAL